MDMVSSMKLVICVYVYILRRWRATDVHGMATMHRIRMMNCLSYMKSFISFFGCVATAAAASVVVIAVISLLFFDFGILNVRTGDS